MEEGRRRQRPTAEEVISRLKDDGDFDNLRRKIIRKVKENEELRNSIITEVKQSEVLDQDGSENLKPRQISDAIYQELGKKIMGQISDEVWKVIRNETTKEDIRGTVESVYDRIMNPKPKEEVRQSSPAKHKTNKQNGISAAQAPSWEANMCNESEPQMPPGFSLCDNKVEHKGSHQEQHRHFPLEEAVHNLTNMEDDDMPPGFAIPVTGADAATIPHGGGDADMPLGSISGVNEDIDMPPGFNMWVGVGSGGAMPPGFGTSGSGVVDDDDLDVPPGFG